MVLNILFSQASERKNKKKVRFGPIFPPLSEIGILSTCVIRSFIGWHTLPTSVSPFLQMLDIVSPALTPPVHSTTASQQHSSNPVLRNQTSLLVSAGVEWKGKGGVLQNEFADLLKNQHICLFKRSNLQLINVEPQQSFWRISGVFKGGWESEMRGNWRGEGEAHRNAWLPVHTEAVCV